MSEGDQVAHIFQIDKTLILGSYHLLHLHLFMPVSQYHSSPGPNDSSAFVYNFPHLEEWASRITQSAPPPTNRLEKPFGLVSEISGATQRTIMVHENQSNIPEVSPPCLMCR
jgi:hypothetical protein